MPSADDDGVAIRGTVKSGIAWSASLMRNNKSVATSRQAGEVLVTLDDGSEMAVDVPDDAKLVGHVTNLRGAWSDLRGRREASGIEREIVPPFTEVELLVRESEPGAPIAVLGEVTDRAFVDAAGSHRDAPPAKPIAIRARIVAFGEGASAALEQAEREERPVVKRPARPARRRTTDPGDPRTPAALEDWIPSGVALGCAVVSVIGFASLKQPVTLAHGAYVLAWGAIAFGARPQGGAPAFFIAAESASRGTPFWLLRSIVWMALGLAAMMVPDHGAVLVWGSAVALAGLAVLHAVDDRRDRGLIAQLARKSEAVALDGGGWQVIEGTVVDPTPVTIAESAAAIAVAVNYQHGGRRDPEVERSRELLNKETFTIRVGDDDVVVDPQDIVWATTVTRTRKAYGAGYDRTFEAWIPVGGRVVACGLVAKNEQDALVLRSEGTRPAVVLATSREGAPRAYARSILLDHRFTVAALALFALFEVGLSFLRE